MLNIIQREEPAFSIHSSLGVRMSLTLYTAYHQLSSPCSSVFLQPLLFARIAHLQMKYSQLLMQFVENGLSRTKCTTFAGGSTECSSYFNALSVVKLTKMPSQWKEPLDDMKKSFYSLLKEHSTNFILLKKIDNR